MWLKSLLSVNWLVILLSVKLKNMRRQIQNKQSWKMYVCLWSGVEDHFLWLVWQLISLFALCEFLKPCLSPQHYTPDQQGVSHPALHTASTNLIVWYDFLKHHISPLSTVGWTGWVGPCPIWLCLKASHLPNASHMLTLHVGLDTSIGSKPIKFQSETNVKILGKVPAKNFVNHKWVLQVYWETSTIKGEKEAEEFSQHLLI